MAVARLERVRAGDVGDVGEPRAKALVGLPVPAVERPRAAAIEEAGGLFVDRNDVGVPGRVGVQIALRLLLVSTFEQQPVADRRGPAALHEVQRGEAPEGHGLGRMNRTRIVPITPLLVGVERELVLLVALIGQPAGRVLLLREEDALRGRVRDEQPAIGRKRVGIPAGHQALVVLKAHGSKEPQLVALDRPAHAAVHVVGQLQLVRRGETARHELVVQVVRLEVVVHARREHRSGQVVAAILGHVVHAHAAGHLLGRDRGVVDDQFLRGAHVGHVVGELAARPRVADTNAVDHEAGVVAAAAVHRQRHVLQVVRAAHVGQRAARARGIHLQSGDERRQIEVAPAGRNGVHHFLREHALAVDALHVHDGASPVTVTDSSRLPTRISMLIVAVKLPVSSIPVR